MARPNRTRELIIDAAVTLAADQGISSTSMDAIAEQAGVAKGSLYYNFASKDELYSAVFTHMRERIESALAEAREADSQEGSPAARATRALVDVFFEAPNAARLAIIELIRTDRAWADNARALRTTLVAEFSRAIRASKPNLDREFDADTAAVALLGAVLMSSLDCIAFRAEASKTGLIASLKHLAEHGLAH